MDDAVSFSILSEKDRVIAKHFTAGAQIILGEDALAVDLSGSNLRFLCSPAWKVLPIPREGDWYIVSTRSFVFTCKIEGAFPYYDRAFPFQIFHLGLTSQFSAKAAHLHGLRRWIQGREVTTSDNLCKAMHDLIGKALHEASRGIVLPERPTHMDYVKVQRSIEIIFEKMLFPVLYENGICICPNTCRIINFTKPFIELLQ